MTSCATLSWMIFSVNLVYDQYLYTVLMLMSNSACASFYGFMSSKYTQRQSVPFNVMLCSWLIYNQLVVRCFRRLQTPFTCCNLAVKKSGWPKPRSHFTAENVEPIFKLCACVSSSYEQERLQTDARSLFYYIKMIMLMKKNMTKWMRWDAVSA